MSAARLEAGEGWGAAQADTVPPADGAPVSVVGHVGADALAAALGAVAEASVALDLAHSMPVLLGFLSLNPLAFGLGLGLAKAARGSSGVDNAR